MRKKLLFLFLTFAIGSSAYSQSKFYALDAPPYGKGAELRGISSNGRYVVGKSLVGGFFFDTQQGTPGESNAIIMMNPNEPEKWDDYNGYATDVSNTGRAVGVFPDSTYIAPWTDSDGNEYVQKFLLSGGVWENGKWTSLGIGPDREKPGLNETGCGSIANAITSDGKIIGGLYRNKDNNLIPCTWHEQSDGTWKIQEWAGPPTSNTGSLGSSILALSKDGKRAAGQTNPDGHTLFKAIAWKSPTEYRIFFFGEAYTGATYDISDDGRYAIFETRRTGSMHTYIYDFETDEIQFITSLPLHGISNDKIAVGPLGMKYFDENIGVISKKNVQEFIDEYASDAVVPDDFWQGVDMPRYISADSKTFAGYTWNGVLPTSARSFVLKMDKNPTTTEPAPLNAKAVLVSEIDRNKVKITWDSPKTPEGVNVESYKIFRNRSKEIVSVPANLNSYIIEGEPGGKNEYTVVAVYAGDKRSSHSIGTTLNIIKTFDMPLYDNFNSDSYETHGWTFYPRNSVSSNPGWSLLYGAGMLNSIGAYFNKTIQKEESYSESLVSRYIDPKDEKEIHLSFLFSIIGERQYISPRPDTLNVEILTNIDNNTWEGVYQHIIRDGKSYGFESVDLSKYAGNGLFKVRFRISGDGRSYFRAVIDNVNVNNQLPLLTEEGYIPKDLLISPVKNNNNDQVVLGWKDPGGLYGLTYMDGFNVENQWGQYSLPYIAAIEFDASSYSIYKDFYLTSITAYIENGLYEESRATLSLYVDRDGERIVNQRIKKFTKQSWNTFELDEPVALNEGEKIRLGIDVEKYSPNDWIIGLDVGPAWHEKGNLVYLKHPDYPQWTTLMDERKNPDGTNVIEIKQNKNWSIVGNVMPLDAEKVDRRKDVIGYEIFRNGEKIDNGMYVSQVFTDEFPPKDRELCYEVRAYYDSEKISKFSEPICITLTGIEDSKIADDGFKVYPNPAKDDIYIEGEFNGAYIYDMSGKILLQSKESPLKVNELANGIYILSIETDKGIITRKVVINK